MLRRRGSQGSGARGGLRSSTEAKEGCEMATTMTMDCPYQESGQKKNGLILRAIAVCTLERDLLGLGNAELFWSSR